MWICERCGERHEDQFKECWNCHDQQFTEHVTATPPKPAPSPRELRSIGSILVRAMIAAGIGLVLGLAIFHRGGTSLETASFWTAILAGGCGLTVGLFLWVLFPYEPSRMPEPLEDEEEQLPLDLR
jgi:hypothetical protein